MTASVKHLDKLEAEAIHILRVRVSLRAGIR